MASFEFAIGNTTYVLKSEDSDNHLRDVSELVKRKVDALRKKNPELTIQKAILLVAFDLASELIKGQKRGFEYRQTILHKTHELIHRVEKEMAEAT